MARAVDPSLVALFALSLIVGTVSNETPRITAISEPRVLQMVFVIVTDPRTPGASFDRAAYEAVLRRAAKTLDRETLHRIELRSVIEELPLGDAALGYGARTFLEWYADLKDSIATKRYDVIAFGPDRPERFCTDAHSLGVVVDGVRFTCLETPTPLPRISNLLVHKLFHTFGFFHQSLRSKPYRLLDWEMGLPSQTQLADVVTDERLRPELDNIAFFSQPARVAIDGTLGCRAPADHAEECADVTGPFARDADRDGIRDDRDGYPASPPVLGLDEDGDGIPDALDLCPGTRVVVTGDIEGGPMTYWSRSKTPRFDATFDGKPLEVRWAAASVAGDKALGDLIYFDERLESVGGPIALPPAVPVRVRFIYAYRGQLVRRSVYVYGESSKTSPGPWAYFNEKEWFYFGRFGCDPPVTWDAYDTASYDADADGLPDARIAPFDVARLATYDWDGDGVPDHDDTLPTVAGHCQNAHVRGVKDSDGDGFCDPGFLSFAPIPTIDRETYFGEIPTGMGNDPDFDRCPYLAGPNHGCPARADGKPWYADP